MIGPILGPTLGGYLTELYNWRYVFFVNLPFGIAATVGLWYALPAEKQQGGLRFDWFGFTALAIGVGGLQLMLDRGETKDWFGSTEILIEATMAVVGFYLFIVHMFTGERPFVSPALFKDRNLVMGFLVMFAVGHGAAGDIRVAGAVAAGTRQLPGGGGGPAAGTARDRHDDRHDDLRPDHQFDRSTDRSWRSASSCWCGACGGCQNGPPR